MNTTYNSYKLIIAGNTNIPAMINAIIRATLQLRLDEQKKQLTFGQIHIFHTEQSLHSLMSSALTWQEALNHYDIPTTSLIHYITKLEDGSVERFSDLVEQLRTIIDPLYNTYHYIDLTGGISSLKAILAVFAYVLDIKNIYMLEIQFSPNREEGFRQKSLFYQELEKEEVKIEYRQFPPIRKFDEFGKLNYTEILRYRQIVTELTEKLALILPTKFDLEYLRVSLLSGVNTRLLGEVTGEVSNYRHAVFSSAAGVEEVANIILNILESSAIENQPLGTKLNEVKNLLTKNPKYFINEKILEHLTRLIVETRNEIVHPSPVTNKNREVTAIHAHLSSQLALTFLQFAIKAIDSFLDQDGKLVNVETLDPQKDTGEAIFYFGFDGDATGDYMEIAFSESNQDETEILKRSEAIRTTIKTLSNLIKKRTKNNGSVLFAEGDNILFKAHYQQSLINELQKVYREKMGLYSSIGYGQTLQEATIAMRLAKAKQGDSVVGIAIKDQAS